MGEGWDGFSGEEWRVRGRLVGLRGEWDVRGAKTLHVEKSVWRLLPRRDNYVLASHVFIHIVRVTIYG